MKFDILTIQHEIFFKELEKESEIFFVGGAVRDEILGINNKDIDILVKGISLDKIEEILKPFGKCVMNLVGGKQAVLKFIPFNSDEEIDISIPRTEKKISNGHTGFDIIVDPNLPIEADLERRDFSINSFARDKNFNYIDPFGGREDLKNKIIRVTNTNAFLEDPLRLLRCIQFASRFGFTIEPETFKMIQDNCQTIQQITGERILKELSKIVLKGSPKIGIELLNQSGLFQAIFGKPFKGDLRMFRHSYSIGDFIFCLLFKQTKPSQVYKFTLKGDSAISAEIEAYELAFQKTFFEDWENRLLAFRMYKISPLSFKSKILPVRVKIAIEQLEKELYPKTLTEVNINGNDLMELGLKGKEVGEMLNLILLLIFKNKLKNKQTDLINYVKSQN